MKRAIFMVLISTVVAAELAADSPTQSVEGTCQCAAFKDEKDATGEPMLSKTPGFKVACTDNGKEDCKKMCVALAQAAKDRVPKLLCEKLTEDVDLLKPAAFYKACDAPEWTYTEVSATEPICCQKNEAIPCKVME